MLFLQSIKGLARDMTLRIICILCVVLLLSCGQDNPTTSSSTDALKAERQLFRTIPAEASGVTFKNEIEEGPYRNALFWDYFYNGAGVSVGDINNDGLVDLFFTKNDGPNALYLNKGGLTFEDISATALPPLDAWSTGTVMVDINNDGFLDIYVCNAGYVEDTDLAALKNRLYINNGDLTFSDKTDEYGVGDTGYSIHASFFDYDRDGDLDLWVNNHDNFSTSGEATYNRSKMYDSRQQKQRMTRLYRNNGGKFEDVSEEAGVAKLAFGLGIATADFNGDGWTDVYISNDYFLPDFYYINNQDGTFGNMDKALAGHTSYYSMGVDAADFNNDNEIDLVAVDMTPQDHFRNKTLMESMDSERFKMLYEQMKLTRSYMFNSLQVNMGRGYFSEVGQANGIGSTEWSWAPLMADFNNDGLKDIYVTNGYYRDSKDNDFKIKVEEYAQQKNEPYNEEHFAHYQSIINSTPVQNRIFRFNGEKFEDVSAKWSDLEPTFSNGAAYADLDNDGDLDLVISNLSQPASILENTSTANYLRINLTDNSSDATLYNTKAMLYTSMGMQRLDFYPSRGFQSSVEPVLHFGLGKVSAIDSLVILWPDDTKSVVTDIEINKLHELDKGALSSEKASLQREKVLFVEKTTEYFDSYMMHKEYGYDDFAKEVLLPQKYSDMGPCMAVADVDGDGDQDVYLGSANGGLARLYLQENGKWNNTEVAAFDYHKDFEDLGAHFFDYDGDGDMDLYVASGGGGEIEDYPHLTQDRLYVNSGDGKFLIYNSGLPKMETSTKAVISTDTDGDGDLDLLVGGRNTPGKYPLDAPSYYLENIDGKFMDNTAEVLPVSLGGMVTGLEKSDLDGDGDEDIIVVGEWSSPKILINDGGKYMDVTPKDLAEKSGWWQSVTKLDADGDGDMDFILGNIGENNKFHPSDSKPLGVIANDFDESGTIDIVLTKKYKDMTVPVRGKECSSQQMPFLNEKFPTYAGFASSSIEDILGEEKIAAGKKKYVNDFSSYLLINNGGLDFDIVRLPEEAQWSPIMGAVADDFNRDGKIDVFIAGNKIKAEPETPSYDAGKGLFLINQGKGKFKSMYKITETGVLANRDARGALSLESTDGTKGILVPNNDTRFQYFVPNK